MMMKEAEYFSRNMLTKQVEDVVTILRNGILPTSFIEFEELLWNQYLHQNQFTFF